MRRKRLAAQATLAIDWPEGMRHGTTLELNGATKDVPRLGTIQFRCPPGETRILATAPGYRPIELVEELKAGERHSVRFRWRELAAVAKADASEENGGAGGEKSPLQSRRSTLGRKQPCRGTSRYGKTGREPGAEGVRCCTRPRGEVQGG